MDQWSNQNLWRIFGTGDIANQYNNINKNMSYPNPNGSNTCDNLQEGSGVNDDFNLNEQDLNFSETVMNSIAESWNYHTNNIIAHPSHIGNDSEIFTNNNINQNLFSNQIISNADNQDNLLPSGSASIESSKSPNIFNKSKAADHDNGNYNTSSRTRSGSISSCDSSVDSNPFAYKSPNTPASSNSSTASHSSSAGSSSRNISPKMKVSKTTSNSSNNTNTTNTSTNNNKRSRLGCLTCRQRKKRCCETKPKCYECSRLGLNCVWPTPGLEHKNRPKSAKINDNIFWHEVYGKMKIARGIVESSSSRGPK